MKPVHILGLDPGTEQYLPFAKKKVAMLDAERAKGGMPYLARKLLVGDGTVIFIEADQFACRIRITGGPFWIADTATEEVALAVLTSGAGPLRQVGKGITNGNPAQAPGATETVECVSDSGMIVVTRLVAHFWKFKVYFGAKAVGEFQCFEGGVTTVHPTKGGDRLSACRDGLMLATAGISSPSQLTFKRVKLTIPGVNAKPGEKFNAVIETKVIEASVPGSVYEGQGDLIGVTTVSFSPDLEAFSYFEIGPPFGQIRVFRSDFTSAAPTLIAKSQIPPESDKRHQTTGWFGIGREGASFAVLDERRESSALGTLLVSRTVFRNGSKTESFEVEAPGTMGILAELLSLSGSTQLSEDAATFVIGPSQLGPFLPQVTTVYGSGWKLELPEPANPQLLVTGDGRGVLCSDGVQFVSAFIDGKSVAVEGLPRPAVRDDSSLNNRVLVGENSTQFRTGNKSAAGTVSLYRWEDISMIAGVVHFGTVSQAPRDDPSKSRPSVLAIHSVVVEDDTANDSKPKFRTKVVATANCAGTGYFGESSGGLTQRYSNTRPIRYLQKSF